MLTKSHRLGSLEEFESVVASDYYTADSYLTPVSFLTADSCLSRGSERGCGFKLDTTHAGLMPITSFSGPDMGVRRSWQLIRKQPSNLYLIWFPLEGTISITQDGVHDAVAKHGDFAITCGDRPFHIRASSDEQAASCRQVHVLVPSHLIQNQVPHIDRFCGRVFSARSGSAAIARDLFAGLIAEAAETNPNSAEKLGLAGLEAIADAIGGRTEQDGPQDVKQMQLARVLSFIRRHIATPGLTVDRVAEGCDISRRYVHYLMKRHNTTFGEYLWNCRLEQAHHWLTAPKFNQLNIITIAYMAGFRGASHFSHAYRERYGMVPREMRKQSAAQAPAA